MNSRVVVDPITRIEGHLRIEAETSDNVITSAYSSGTMVRGIEIILRGRDPRDAWAFAQRICGVCTLVHGIASVRAVENALSYPIPPNAQLIRNLMIAQQFVHDHVMHFYHLHALDWVNVPDALNASPSATAELQQSLSSWQNNSRSYFEEVQQTLRRFIESGQLGIFTNGYWEHPGYKLPPEVNLLAFAHYLEALEWQREVAKVQAIFGGKNPHPNFAVGGAPTAINATLRRNGSVRFREGDTAVDREGLELVGSLIEKMRTFVDKVYLPDTLAIAGYYKDWFSRGEGVGNFLTYGEFPAQGDALTANLGSMFIPRGAILGRNLDEIHQVDLTAEGEIQEYLNHSWYEGEQPLHPFDGETVPNYTGPEPPYDFLDVSAKYSWLKSPRWKGNVMETGPLARVLMLYASNHTVTRNLVDQALEALELELPALYSTMGRTAARTLETKIIADQMPVWYNQLMANIAAGDLDTHNFALFSPDTWPATSKGAGFMEAPRGALGHWIVIENEKIANYQAVVPSTWNAGPRDQLGKEGPYEAALRGQPLHEPTQPLEILRTIHSFDPCIACAVHVTDPDGQELVRVKVR